MVHANVNIAKGHSRFLWPSVGGSRVEHIKKYRDNKTESRYSVEETPVSRDRLESMRERKTERTREHERTRRQERVETEKARITELRSRIADENAQAKHLPPNETLFPIGHYRYVIDGRTRKVSVKWEMQIANPLRGDRVNTVA